MYFSSDCSSLMRDGFFSLFRL